MPQSGKLVIVSGPSGVGKGTLLRRVFAESSLPLVFSVSATTRAPRAGEEDSVHYFFLTRDEFLAKRSRGEFLECFEVYTNGDWYGTPALAADEAIAAGKWVVLEIDCKGAMAIKESRGDALTVFIEPPDFETLAKRLRGRGSESDESLQKRLAQAQHELSQSSRYDARIVNDDLTSATQKFCELLEQHR